MDIVSPDAITTRSQEPHDTAETALPSKNNDIRGKIIKTVPMETVGEEPSGEGEYLEAAEDTVSQDVPALMETVEEKPAGEGGEKGEETTAQVQCLNI